MRSVPRAKAKRKQRQAEIATLVDSKVQRKFEREADNHLIDLEERALERYAWAKKLKDVQSHDVQVAVNRMVAVMARMAGPVKFRYQGATLNVDGGQERLNRIQLHNHTWVAMRLLVTCAEWGIRIGDFKAPKGECIRCGKAVKR